MISALDYNKWYVQCVAAPDPMDMGLPGTWEVVPDMKPINPEYDSLITYWHKIANPPETVS